MTTQPSYTSTHIPAGDGYMVWLLADNKLANLPEWQAKRWVVEGKAKWAQIHVRHKQHMPPWGDVAPSTDPHTVDVYIPGSDTLTL